jgi:hypothetical protein
MSTKRSDSPRTNDLDFLRDRPLAVADDFLQAAHVPRFERQTDAIDRFALRLLGFEADPADARRRAVRFAS